MFSCVWKIISICILGHHMCLIVACVNEEKKRTLAEFSKHALRILNIVSFSLKATSAS